MASQSSSQRFHPLLIGGDPRHQRNQPPELRQNMRRQLDQLECPAPFGVRWAPARLQNLVEPKRPPIPFPPVSSRMGLLRTGRSIGTVRYDDWPIAGNFLDANKLGLEERLDWLYALCQQPRDDAQPHSGLRRLRFSPLSYFFCACPWPLTLSSCTSCCLRWLPELPGISGVGPFWTHPTSRRTVRPC